MAADGVICQVCGIEAPARYIVLHQNVGALVIRFHRSFKGRLCKRCVHKKYWKVTGITLGVGWLGTLSIILGPCLVVANTVNYLKALGMPPVPDGATIPFLNPAAISRLTPLRGEIFERLNRREELIAIANDMARRANVTPGQLVKFVASLQKPQNAPPQPQKTQGIAVIPLPAAAGTQVAQTPPPADDEPGNLPPPMLDL